jgi:hypothetical protein
MAVYAGQGRRRRATVAIAVGALIVGLLAGFAIGKASAPSLGDKISEGRDRGRDFVTALGVLPLEYGQALQGSEGSGLIGDTVKRSSRGLAATLDKQPWLGPAQRRQATAAVQAIETAATDKVDAQRFETVVRQSTATLQSVFGLPPLPSGSG